MERKIDVRYFIARMLFDQEVERCVEHVRSLQVIPLTFEFKIEALFHCGKTYGLELPLGSRVDCRNWTRRITKNGGTCGHIPNDNRPHSNLSAFTDLQIIANN